MVNGCVFETAWGHAGLGWSADGLVRVVIPAEGEAAAWRRLGEAEKPGALPGFVAGAIALLQDYFAGKPTDFSGIPVDLTRLDDFDSAILGAARRLGHGETTTYGSLAAMAGHAGLFRETGAALGRNPVPVIVPCHRILAAGGKPGGFSAPGGTRTKLRLLALEGVDLAPPPPAQASFAF